MLKVSTEVELPAAPAKVWSVLTDFDSYPSWHPWLRISGDPGPANQVTCSFDPKMEGKPFRLDAQIEEWDRPFRFAWTWGVDWVFKVREQFVLHKVSSGTRVEHSFHCRGIAAALGPLLRRRIEALLAASNSALRTRLASGHKASKDSRAVRPKRGRR